MRSFATRQTVRQLQKSSAGLCGPIARVSRPSQPFKDAGILCALSCQQFPLDHSCRRSFARLKHTRVPALPRQHDGPRVAVLGNGVVGLATAVQLIGKYPHVHVDIIADKDITETTSYGSGGLWEPYQLAGTADSLVNRWGTSTFAHLSSILTSTAAAEAGVQLVSGFSLFSTALPPKPSWHGIVYSFRPLERRQIDGLGMGRFESGWAFDTIVADQSHYMPYLWRLAEASGRVAFVQQALASVRDVSENGYSVVFNCTGLGSESLMNDPDCFPIRGQVARVRAPWLKHMYMFDDSHYVIPNVDTVVLGGTQQSGRYDAAVDAGDSADILGRVTDCVPSLASAQVVRHWAGLRPARRSGVRVEREAASVHSVPVVHNYGHGGSGVTLHWGCVQDALELAAQDLAAAA